MQGSLSSIKDYVTKNIGVTLSLCTSGDIITTLGPLQHVFRQKFKHSHDLATFQVLLTYVGNAEKACPGAGTDVLKLLLGHKIDSDNSLPMTMSDLEAAFCQMKLSQVNRNLVIAALNLCSLNGKMTIKRSSGGRDFIEVSNGFNFDAVSLCTLQKMNVSLEDAKIVCIDGYIESVSEIHHILSYLAENRTACVLLSRGMSQDVLHTISVNNARSTLSLYPFQVAFDLDNVNSMVDVAAVTDDDVVSSNKGDLISAIDMSTWKNVTRTTLQKDCIVIHQAANESRLADHVKQLGEKLEDRPELESMVSRRIRSLSAVNVDISLADDIDFLSRSQQIDQGIRFVKSNLMGSIGRKETAEHYYESFMTMVNSIGCIV